MRSPAALLRHAPHRCLCRTHVEVISGRPRAQTCALALLFETYTRASQRRARSPGYCRGRGEKAPRRGCVRARRAREARAPRRAAGRSGCEAGRRAPGRARPRRAARAAPPRAAGGGPSRSGLHGRGRAPGRRPAPRRAAPRRAAGGDLSARRRRFCPCLARAGRARRAGLAGSAPTRLHV